MNSDHAPTAEQLPMELPPIPEYRPDWDGNRAEFELTYRRDQLLASIRENRNAESELAIARDLIATMRARIAELERKPPRTWTQYKAEKVNELEERAEAAEAKLRAVSDALDEKMQHWTPEGATWAYYVKSEVDARDARIRAIVEDK